MDVRRPILLSLMLMVAACSSSPISPAAAAVKDEVSMFLDYPGGQLASPGLNVATEQLSLQKDYEKAFGKPMGIVGSPLMGASYPGVPIGVLAPMPKNIPFL
ncbi:uncharacterized protein LOC143023998 [Oratosquilla oratoria]|uniref:uncharacterized protein LOC143023998 n=1 Tax=Oratosquilla oratoria TaxID=337810 RepID=UPI003F761ECA